MTAHADRDRSEQPVAVAAMTGTDGNRLNSTGGYRCCQHCAEDDVHDIPEAGHEVLCQTCDSPNALLLERVVAAERALADERAKVAAGLALAGEWASASGLPVVPSFADLEAASPAQRTLREAADDLHAALTSGPEPDTTEEAP